MRGNEPLSLEARIPLTMDDKDLLNTIDCTFVMAVARLFPGISPRTERDEEKMGDHRRGRTK